MAGSTEERLRNLEERFQTLRTEVQADDERKIKVNTDINTLKVWMNRTQTHLGSLETLDLQGLEDRLRSSTGEVVRTHAERLRGETAELVKAHADQLKEETEASARSTLEVAFAARGAQTQGEGQTSALRELEERLASDQETLRMEFHGIRDGMRAGLEALDHQLTQATSDLEARLAGASFRDTSDPAVGMPSLDGILRDLEEVRQIQCDMGARVSEEVARASGEKLDGFSGELHQLRAALAHEVSAREQDRTALLATMSSTVAATQDDLRKRDHGIEQASDKIAEVLGRLNQVEIQSKANSAGMDFRLRKAEADFESLKLGLEEVHASVQQMPPPDSVIEESLEILKGNIEALRSELEASRLDWISGEGMLRPPRRSSSPPLVVEASMGLTLEDAAGQIMSFDKVSDFLPQVAQRLKELQETIEGEVSARMELERQLSLEISSQRSAQVQQPQELFAHVVDTLKNYAEKDDFIYINGEVMSLKKNVKELEQRVRDVKVEASRGVPLQSSTSQAEDVGAGSEVGEMKLIEDLQRQSVRLQTLARECHSANVQAGPPSFSPGAPLESAPDDPQSSPVEVYVPAGTQPAFDEPQRPLAEQTPEINGSLSPFATGESLIPFLPPPAATLTLLPNGSTSALAPREPLASPRSVREPSPICRRTGPVSPMIGGCAGSIPLQMRFGAPRDLSPLASRCRSTSRELRQVSTGPSLVARAPSRDRSPVARRQISQLSVLSPTPSQVVINGGASLAKSGNYTLSPRTSLRGRQRSYTMLRIGR